MAGRSKSEGASTAEAAELGGESPARAKAEEKKKLTRAPLKEEKQGAEVVLLECIHHHYHLEACSLYGSGDKSLLRNIQGSGQGNLGTKAER